MILPYIGAHSTVHVIVRKWRVWALGLIDHLETFEQDERYIIPVRRGNGFHPDWLALQKASKRKIALRAMLPQGTPPINTRGVKVWV